MYKLGIGLDEGAWSWRSSPSATQTDELMDPELEPHFHNVVRATFDGRLIPVLGAGVNLSGRPPKLSWEFGQYNYLPSGAELASYLARYFDYPADDESRAKDLVRVAQYVAVMAGPGPLYERLREVFDGDYEPSPVTACSLASRLGCGRSGRPTSCW